MSVKIKKYIDIKAANDDTIEAANIELLTRVTAQAKSLSPVDTGSLKNSIMWKTSKMSGGHSGGNTLSEIVTNKHDGIVGSATEYAVYQEFGTRNQPGKPFLRPAILIEFFGLDALETMARFSKSKMKEKRTRG